VAVGRVATRALNHPGERRRLGERDVTQFLAEEDARRLPDAAHRD
jgi:hypothetical protein